MAALDPAGTINGGATNPAAYIRPGADTTGVRATPLSPVPFAPAPDPLPGPAAAFAFDAPVAEGSLMERLSDDCDRRNVDGNISPDWPGLGAPILLDRSCRGLWRRGTASSSAVRVREETGLGAVARYGRKAGLMLTARSRSRSRSRSGMPLCRWRIGALAGLLSVAPFAGVRFFLRRTPSGYQPTANCSPGP
jgi:hypothetical protein